MGHLMGKLGHAMEVRDCPLGEFFWGVPVCLVRVLMEECALHWGSEEDARLSPEVEEKTPGVLDPCLSTTLPFQCVTLDKLEAVPSETALVERALALLAEHCFWDSVIFLGPEDSLEPEHLPGPGHVRIKIHMDVDNVIRTNKIQDRCSGGIQII